MLNREQKPKLCKSAQSKMQRFFNHVDLNSRDARWRLSKFAPHTFPQDFFIGKTESVPAGGCKICEKHFKQVFAESYTCNHAENDFKFVEPATTDKSQVNPSQMFMDALGRLMVHCHTCENCKSRYNEFITAL